MRYFQNSYIRILKGTNLLSKMPLVYVRSCQILRLKDEGLSAKHFAPLLKIYTKTSYVKSSGHKSPENGDMRLVVRVSVAAFT